MSKKLISFFATHGDLVAVARVVAEIGPVDIVVGGLLTDPKPVILTDIDDMIAFGAYLVVIHGDPVNLRVVVQREGGQKYAVDQIENPHAIALQTGGRLADQQLIAGQLGTVGNNKRSDELHSLFAGVMKKRYEKIKSYYVGPEAVAMLDSGVRLSATRRSPPTFDLVR